MHKILVTGGSGFVGRSLLECLAKKPYSLIVATRKNANEILTGTAFVIQGFDQATDWSQGLQGVQTVIHLASRVHVMNDTALDPLEEFRKVNVAGTIRLAEQAAQAGIKRFIFISSIGVNGDYTVNPFCADDPPNPLEPYAISKYEAEQSLQKLSKEYGFELVIIRPPLVYGANAPGNFGKLVKLIAKGYPLPLGAIKNKRSLVSINNLISLIMVCIEHPLASNQIFLVSDDEDISTTDLLRRVARVLSVPARLIPVPMVFLQLAAKMLRKEKLVQKVCGSLQLDISKTKELLAWTPLESVDQGLSQILRSFNDEKTV